MKIDDQKKEHPEVANTKNICDIAPKTKDTKDVCEKINSAKKPPSKKPKQ